MKLFFFSLPMRFGINKNIFSFERSTCFSPTVLDIFFFFSTQLKREKRGRKEMEGKKYIKETYIKQPL
jgi:hypothetical protein